MLSISGATALSRVTGYARTFVQAAVIGTGGRVAEAYTYSNTLPNQVYELFMGGLLSSIFIPLLIERLTHHGENDARRLTSALVYLDSTFPLRGRALRYPVRLTPHKHRNRLEGLPEALAGGGEKDDGACGPAISGVRAPDPLLRHRRAGDGNSELPQALLATGSRPGPQQPAGYSLLRRLRPARKHQDRNRDLCPGLRHYARGRADVSRAAAGGLAARLQAASRLRSPFTAPRRPARRSDVCLRRGFCRRSGGRQLFPALSSAVYRTCGTRSLSSPSPTASSSSPSRPP